MWDERYAQDGFWFGTEPADFLKRHSGLLRPGSDGLAIADGEGRNSVYMAAHGVETTAFDASPVAIAKARSLAQDRQVEIAFHVADVESWSWEEDRFDVVVAIFIQFLGPHEMATTFEAMRRTLRPGGRILLHGYRPEQLAYRTGGPSAVENLYTEALLREAFAGMEIEHLASYDAEIREGVGHHGRSALVDLVARKPPGEDSV